MKRVILDTNIILRLADKTSKEHKQSYSIVKRLLSEGYEVCIIPQVLIEFWVVATRPLDSNGFEWDVDMTLQKIKELQDIFILLHDNELIFKKWLKIVSDGVKGKRAHDARIAAAAQAHEVDAIATLNINDFKNFSIDIISS